MRDAGLPSGRTRPHERLDWIDWTRGIGIVLVVAGHVFTGPVVRVLYLFHMPLFFMLSGAVFRPRPMREFLRRRAATLGIPYLAWLLLIASIAAGYERLGWRGGKPFDPGVLLHGGHLLRGAHATFWFATCLLAALTSYNALRRRFGVTDPVLVASMLLLTAGGALVAPHRLPGAINVAPIALVLVWLGGLCGRQPLGRPWLALAGAMGAVGVVALRSLDMKNGRLGTPGLSLLAAVAISVLLFEAARAVAGRWSTPWLIRRLSAASLVIMFLHPSIYVPLKHALPSWLVFALAVLGPLGVHEIIRARGGVTSAFLLGGGAVRTAARSEPGA